MKYSWFSAIFTLAITESSIDSLSSIITQSTILFAISKRGREAFFAVTALFDALSHNRTQSEKIPVTDIGKSMTGMMYELSNRQGVKQTAVFPLLVQTPGNIQFGFGAEMTIVYLTVISNSPDSAHQPFLVKADKTADIA